MRLPRERGPLSRCVIDALGTDAEVCPPLLTDAPLARDDDTQLALWILYELHYRGFEGVPDEREWDPSVLALRGGLERRLERELRRDTAGILESAGQQDPSDVGGVVLALVANHEGPALATQLQRRASREQVLDYLTQRSLQQLKESDPQSFVLPRLEGPAKVALAELQYDEYGGGRPEHLHQRLYAEALEAAGLDSGYGAYVDEVEATSLLSANVMSFFALHRRLRGAAMGHFAAFEASSSAPSRRIAIGLERLDFPPAVAAYFHEHVEADAVHEQVAARDICGALVATHPELYDDVLFGAATCLHVDDLSGHDLLARWQDGQTLEQVS